MRRSRAFSSMLSSGENVLHMAIMADVWKNEMFMMKLFMLLSGTTVVRNRVGCLCVLSVISFIYSGLVLGIHATRFILAVIYKHYIIQELSFYYLANKFCSIFDDHLPFSS